MLFRPRPENMELLILKELKVRMVFNESEELTYFTVEKGYEGELRSDFWLKGLTNNWLILNHLLFDYRGSLFQIDTMIIAFEKIYLLDVKNFEGDYSVKDDKWYNPADILQKNPLHQLERCETLLKKLLHELGYHFSIDSYLIFNNPEFHLYTTSKNPAIIFPTQLNRFLKKLNTRPVKLNKRHFDWAQKLVDRHIEESPYKRIFNYTYEQQKKGVTCPNCNTFYTNQLTCKNCGYVDEVDAAILRSVKGFILLFPEMKVTTNGIYEWCGGFWSKKVIRRVLSKNYKLVGHRISAHYYVKNSSGLIK